MSTYERQPKEVVDEILVFCIVDAEAEPKFAEPDQRIRRRRGRVGVALAVVAMTVGESFQETPEEAATSMKHICAINSNAFLYDYFEHSAMESVPIPDQISKHASGISRGDDQSVESHVTRNR